MGALQDSTKCPICREKSETGRSGSADIRQFNCPRCGRFDVTGSAVPSLRSATFEGRVLANASGWIRARQGVSLSSSDISMLSSLKNSTISERANCILKEMFKRSPNIDTKFSFNPFGSKELVEWEGISSSTNQGEVQYLFVEALLRNGLIEGNLSKPMSRIASLLDAYITPAGYAHLEQMSRSGVESQIGFCAMWFDARVLPIWTEAIEPAITAAGYLARRIDQHPHNNRIDDEIIAMIRRSRFVVADFTGNRGGVYFEAGFALGIGLPVIWTIEEGNFNEIHFDNRQYNFIAWSLVDLQGFRERLQNRIEATIGIGPLESSG